MQRGDGKQTIRKLVVSGMLAAIVVVLMITGLGFIQIGPVAATLYCLPVIIGVMSEGLGVGLTLGLTFGVLSLIRSFTPTMPLDLYFQYPPISILPRVLVPVAVWLVVRAMPKASPESPQNAVFFRILAAVVGSLTNTFLVLGAIYIAFSAGLVVTGLESLSQREMAIALLGIVLTNGLPEAAVMALVVPPVMGALDRTVYKR